MLDSKQFFIFLYSFLQLKYKFPIQTLYLLISFDKAPKILQYLAIENFLLANKLAKLFFIIE